MHRNVKLGGKLTNKISSYVLINYFFNCNKNFLLLWTSTSSILYSYLFLFIIWWKKIYFLNSQKLWMLILLLFWAKRNYYVFSNNKFYFHESGCFHETDWEFYELKFSFIEVPRIRVSFKKPRIKEKGFNLFRFSESLKLIK